MITALIVEDEKQNRDFLHKQLKENCANISIVAEACCVDEALEQIKRHHPQLVFLDIQMPFKDGFDLLREVKTIDFKIIFVTAHAHYAITAIKFSAVDYLLKPVNPNELTAAVAKVVAKDVLTSLQYKTLLHNIDQGSNQQLAIAIKNGFTFIHINDIIRFEADGPYTHIYRLSEKYTVTKNIREYEDLLKTHAFFRSHKSHLINLNHVKGYSRSEGHFADMSDGSHAQISRRKQEEFMALMRNRRL
jgi:two-component system LytT family response regulator